MLMVSSLTVPSLFKMNLPVKSPNIIKSIYTKSSFLFLLDAIASEILVICNVTPSATVDNSFKNKFLFKSGLDSFMISTIIKHRL